MRVLQKCIVRGWGEMTGHREYVKLVHRGADYIVPITARNADGLWESEIEVQTFTNPEHAAHHYGVVCHSVQADVRFHSACSCFQCRVGGADCERRPSYEEYLAGDAEPSQPVPLLPSCVFHGTLLVYGVCNICVEEETDGALPF